MNTNLGHLFSPNHDAATVRLIAVAAVMYKERENMPVTEEDTALLAKLTETDNATLTEHPAKAMNQCRSLVMSSLMGMITPNIALSQISQTLANILGP